MEVKTNALGYRLPLLLMILWWPSTRAPPHALHSLRPWPLLAPLTPQCAHSLTELAQKLSWLQLPKHPAKLRLNLKQKRRQPLPKSRSPQLKRKNNLKRKRLKSKKTLLTLQERLLKQRSSKHRRQLRTPRPSQKRRSTEAKAKDAATETSTSRAPVVDVETEREVASVDVATVVAEVQEAVAATTEDPHSTEMASQSQARSPPTEETEVAKTEEAAVEEVVRVIPRKTTTPVLEKANAGVEDPRLPNLAPSMTK